MEKKDYKFGSYKNQRRQGGPGGMGNDGEKAKDFKGIIIKIVQYSANYKIFLLLAICIAMLGAIFTLAGPNQITKLTDAITSGISSSMMASELEANGIDIEQLANSGITNEEFAQMAGMTKEELDSMEFDIEALKDPGIDMSQIWSVGILMGIIYGLSYLFSISQGVMLASVMQNIARRLRTDIANKINNLPMSYFSKHTKGDVLSRVTNDVDTIGQSLTQSVGTFITSVTLFLGAIFMMFITNVVLAMTAILSTVIGFVFMMSVMKLSQKYFKRQQKHLGEINGHIEEMYAGHTVVRAYNGEENAQKFFDSVNEKLRDSAFKAQAMSGLMMPMMTFIGNLGYVCVCIVGALLVLNDVIGFGIIVAFMIYIRLFTQPLGQIAQSMQNLQSGAAAAERVFEFLEEEEMSDESMKTKELTDVKGHVEFRNVHFGYDPDRIIVNNFSAIAEAGQKIAIVGPTGAGKTTIINLLMKFYDIQSGDILIDGISTNDVKREEVHSKFCMVLQDTWLFEGTLRENLIYATPEVTEEQLHKACKAVGLHHFIKTLQHGYDTVLNDSINLSQGQKQQITIARAMIADKPMLILDEATSSVDTRTELQIQTAMDQLMSNRTSFVIAHRLSTIKNADMILVMKDGDIIEKGNHTDLLLQNGFYAELYNSQFENQDTL